MSFSIVYDASGRKVNELASSCGWGWSMFGGGQITRIIKGRQDEYGPCISHGYGNPGDDFPFTELIHWNWQFQREPNEGGPFVPPFVEINANFTADPEDNSYSDEQNNFQPDEYYFSFNGRSGMFVINSNGDPVCIPHQDLKITYQECLKWFEIEDEDGWKYRYSEVEETEFGMVTHLGLKRTHQAATTWHLTGITNNKGQTEFNLTYNLDGWDYEESTSILAISFEGDSDCPNEQTSVTTTYNKHQRKTLASVEAPLTGNSISFIYTNTREDITSLKSLDEIVVLNENGIETSRYRLIYGYFLNELQNPERLKLQNIENINQNGQSKTLVSFIYDESLPILSNENLAGTDHWGYFNGLDFNGIENLHVNGGGKRVNPDQNQRGILKELIYSSGQKTSFEYETNTYSNSPNGEVQPQNYQESINISGSITIESDDYYN